MSATKVTPALAVRIGFTIGRTNSLLNRLDAVNERAPNGAMAMLVSAEDRDLIALALKRFRNRIEAGEEPTQFLCLGPHLPTEYTDEP